MPCEVCGKETKTYKRKDGEEASYKRCYSCRGVGRRACCIRGCQKLCSSTGRTQYVACFDHKNMYIDQTCKRCGKIFTGEAWKDTCRSCYTQKATGLLLGVLAHQLLPN